MEPVECGDGQSEVESEVLPQTTPLYCQYVVQTIEKAVWSQNGRFQARDAESVSILRIRVFIRVFPDLHQPDPDTVV